MLRVVCRVVFVVAECSLFGVRYVVFVVCFFVFDVSCRSLWVVGGLLFVVCRESCVVVV